MSETWKLSPRWHGNSYNFTGLSFLSNGETFSSIKVNGGFGDDTIYYDDKYIVYCQDDDYVDWKVDIAYATITFSTPPTGDLLTWLQANGTKQSNKLSVDLTTLSGWANLSAGNHTIKIKAKGTGYRDSELSAGVVVSKAASTVTLEAGTYKWNDNVTLIDIDQDIEFTSNNTKYTIIKSNEGRAVITYTTSYMTAVYNNGVWTNEAYKTITLSTDQQVSPEFYKWAITDGNLVKQTGYNLTINYSTVPMSTGAAYIKINSDTVSSSNYDYVVQPGTSSTNPTLKNSAGTTLTVPYVVPNVEKVAFMGGLAISVSGSTNNTSPYTLTADTTISPGVYGPTADTPIDEPTI